jgi:hypothetical protein
MRRLPLPNQLPCVKSDADGGRLTGDAQSLKRNFCSHKSLRFLITEALFLRKEILARPPETASIRHVTPVDELFCSRKSETTVKSSFAITDIGAGFSSSRLRKCPWQTIEEIG